MTLKLLALVKMGKIYTPSSNFKMAWMDDTSANMFKHTKSLIELPYNHIILCALSKHNSTLHCLLMQEEISVVQINRQLENRLCSHYQW